MISGFIADTETGLEQRTYTAFVSEDFLKEVVPNEQIVYRFLFQVETSVFATTEEIEANIAQLASQFGIAEHSVNVNEDFLWANYIDPAYVPGILAIMLIIVLADVITIYSIYYVSMGERVQEYGKIKAIGATKEQIRKIVLLEGFAVAGIAVPLGLLAGSFLVRYVFWGMFEVYQAENEMISIISQMVADRKLKFLHAWIYLLAALVSGVTVYLSLLGPMRVASRVSEIEAMRYQDGHVKRKKGEMDTRIYPLAVWRWCIFRGTREKVRLPSVLWL